MAKNLYITLLSGRTVHVTDDWDGLEPGRIGTVNADGSPDDGEGIETGEYYRDIHRYQTEVATSAGTLSVTSPSPGSGSPTQISSTTGVLKTVQAALIPTGNLNVETVSVSYNQFTSTVGFAESKNLVPVGFEANPSDEVGNIKPRTWQKVCTWLVFNCVTGGQKRFWRAASVDGWGDQPPID